MLIIEYRESLLKTISKIKDNAVKNKIKKQIIKIIKYPDIGKPMRYARKGTREIYIGSYRLAYFYSQKEYKIIFLDLYH
jgi:hypothetical protein